MGAPIRNTSSHIYVNEYYALLVLCMWRNHTSDEDLLLCHFCFIISWLVRKTQRDLYGSYFWIALCQTWWYLLGENWGRPLFNCGVGLLYDGENEGADILRYYIQIYFIHVRFKKIHWESLWNVPIIYTRSIKLILEIQLRFWNSDFRRKMFPDFSHYFSIYLHH